MKIVPNCLKYQFEPQYALQHNWSDNCCKEFKHGVLAEWELTNGFVNCFTGMRKQEGGNRDKLTCITNGKNGKHFNILVPITNKWEEEFIKRFNIQLCELYLPPYNYQRTGCMFCPFSKDLQKDLDIIEKINPNLYKQANHIWDISYDEYRRIGYRLRPKDAYKQTTIFDYLEEQI